ncbi:hypothetical protein BGX24_009114 [Mortierella sp. AD032]|nr:hypothetical protein BGX24_009114 [Mortierella sp. AD032]
MVADRKELDSFIKDSRGTAAVWTETILSGLAKDLLDWNEGVEDQVETRLIAGQHALSTMVAEPTSCPGRQSLSTTNGQGQDTVERGLEVPRVYYGKETKEAGGDKVMMEAIKDLSTKWKETDQKADRALEHILEMKVLHGVRQQDNEEKIEMLSKELLELKTVLRAQNAVVFAETKRVNSLSSTVTSLEKVIVRAKEGQQATKGQDEKWIAAVEAAVRQLKSETSDMSNRLADLDDE